MLSSGANVIIWVECYHLGQNVIIWDAMLSSGANVIIWDKMLSSGAKVIMVSSGANVIIWCYHVMLSSGMITHPFLIFPENFTHSFSSYWLVHFYLGKKSSTGTFYPNFQESPRRLINKICKVPAFLEDGLST